MAAILPEAEDDALGFRPPPGRGLSGRILLLTVAFVLLGEVLIFLPSIARFRAVWLEERLNVAHLATLPLRAGTELPSALEAELLGNAGVEAITVRAPEPVLMLGREGPADRVVDVINATWPELILGALETLGEGSRTLRVTGTPQGAPTTTIEILVSEGELWREMVAYGWRILALSLVLSLIVAVLVFWALRLLIVKPLRAITGELARFRAMPEDASADRLPMMRVDEIGVVDREFAAMRSGVRQALQQKTRLAALGEAVSKINHDLRAILATAVLVSDRLEVSPDPDVRRTAGQVLDALERATRLCEATLDFARVRPAPPRRMAFDLHDLVGDALRDGVLGGGIALENAVPRGCTVIADRDQLYRVFLNLARNAATAMPEGGRIRVVAGRDEEGGLVLNVEDTGHGIPEQVQAALFQPFVSGRRGGGLGLGLAICREILRNHGGDLAVVSTSSDGTHFRLTLPGRVLPSAGT